MSVKECLMNPQSNRPMIGAVMDALTLWYLITKEDYNIPKEDFMDSQLRITAVDSASTLDERLKSHGVPRFSGRALFSAILPPDFFYQSGNVLILNGVLKRGVISKQHIGTDTGSMIQYILDRYGPNRAAEFITDLCFVAARMFDTMQFTIGIDDCSPENKSYKQDIDKVITKLRLQIKSLGNPSVNPVEEDYREKQTLAFIGSALNEIGNIVSKAFDVDYETKMKAYKAALQTTEADPNVLPVSGEMPHENAIRTMANSGAKGTKFHLTQIAAIVGQQYIRGQRFQPSISKKTRCLPYFEKGDTSPESRGLCLNSYTEGLDPAQFVFASAAGRENMVDIAVRTSESGATNHKIIKALENIVVGYDGSLRNVTGTLFTPVYGDDGFDPSHLKIVRGPTNTFPSFIDLKNVSGTINARFGAYPK